jgi:hypothetical protein
MSVAALLAPQSRSISLPVSRWSRRLLFFRSPKTLSKRGPCATPPPLGDQLIASFSRRSTKLDASNCPEPLSDPLALKSP